MSFKNYIKEKMKYLLGIAGVAALLSQLILPALGAKAISPRFNFLAGDQEMVRGVNVSRDEAIWKNPIDGDAGQIFRGLIYYHNGVVDTAAENTRVKIDIPGMTSNSQAVIGTEISADNAAPITSTVVDGQIVGLNGLHLNLDKDANLEFVPGSVRWFPNSNVNGGPNEQPQTLPFNQTGDEIVSGQGVNIGNIQGCWNFAGFISFDFRSKVKTQPQLNIAIEKMVRNVTAGEANFVKETQARTGNIVEFEVEPKNIGQADLNNAMLKDELPNGLTYVPGSFAKRSGGLITPLSDSDAAIFFDGGLNIGTLPVNQAPESKRFLFKATVSTTSLSDILTNKAIVTAAGLSAASTARVIIVSSNIVKSKSAFNDTKRQPASTVSPNDLVTFTLTAKNTGSAATGFVFEDNVKEVLKFAEIVSISNNGHLTGDVITWPEVGINPGVSISRTFQVKIKNEVSDDCFNNFFGNNVQICVEKKVVVLHLDKFVRDVSTNEANFQKADSAFAGDTLEYMITYSNTGNGPADQAKFTDTLPANTGYIAGTARISRNGGAEQTLPDGITDGGVTVPTIAAGESGFVKFRVKIATGLASGEVLVNTGHLTQAGKTISATAQTTIITQAVTPAQLPKSGATASLSFLITMIGGIGILYLKYRKIMEGTEVAIINQLMSA